MNLRFAAPADAAALADLGARSFVAKFGYMYTPEDLENFLAESHSEAKAAKEIADPAMQVLLAEEEGRLLGFCKLVLACGWPDHARGRTVIELKQLYTDPETTGRGIGSALMDRAMEIAREQEADEMQLSVWSGNEGAQKFYARYGFGKVADIFFMVGDQRDDEFLYARMM
ncbi:GNAT family N-acetyltransferase [Novosphingobium sp.]|jgi:ribosomal protein S18 acetylase RimI-like enzyme|uniref:GNAT family N-acetyltransferase n=1 Tax=Novosphingobium sp. TaxID=1874826 RepID=UPI002FDF8E71